MEENLQQFQPVPKSSLLNRLIKEYVEEIVTILTI